MTKQKVEELKSISLRVREHIIRMSSNGGCFIGASLSCVELLVYLYSEFMNWDEELQFSADRDYFFLSKGHDVPALYGTLAELGFIEKTRLENHMSVSDSIYWHPNVKIPGVEFHSGSLGHLPAVAAGVALDCKINNQANNVIALLGDGELNEGSVWESILVANAHQLYNLTLIIDRNQFQANMKTEDLIPLEPLIEKFISFGCTVRKVNGHDFSQLEQALRGVPYSNNKVNVLIADTIRGKGLPSIESKADRWFCSFTEKEAAQLLEELHGNEKANLDSEVLIVR